MSSAPMAFIQAVPVTRSVGLSSSQFLSSRPASLAPSAPKPQSGIVMVQQERQSVGTDKVRSHSRFLEAGGKFFPNFKPSFKFTGTKRFKDPYQPVDILQNHIQQDPELGELILKSLKKAKENGKKLNNKRLYAKLDWPETLDAYYDYLREYAEWIPQQSGDPAFEIEGSKDQYQEPYIRLCHFYFLIDQPVISGGLVLAQNDAWFRWWLVLYADYWGNYLDTPKSFNKDILNSFRENSPLFAVEDSMIRKYETDISVGNLDIKLESKLIPNNPSGWVTFNQFFARELNGGLRPIDKIGSNYLVTSPSDCTFMETFPIDEDSNVVAGGNGPLKLKFTHKIGNIKDLLKGSPYAEEFAGGTYVHYFLNTYSYHRFHAPVNGILRECRTVRGRVYLDVKIKDGVFDAPDSALDGYEFYQARGLTVWDTAGSEGGNIGLVACLPIGMAQVSSAIMTGTEGKVFDKGEEFGYFQYGGSDIILLFQKKAVKTLTEVDQDKYLHYGMGVAECGAPGY